MFSSLSPNNLMLLLFLILVFVLDAAVEKEKCFELTPGSPTIRRLDFFSWVWNSFLYPIEWSRYFSFTILVTGFACTSVDLRRYEVIRFQAFPIAFLLVSDASRFCHFLCCRSMTMISTNLSYRSLGIWSISIFILCWMPVSNSAPTISSVSKGNQPTSGGTIISVSGSGFVLYSTISSVGDTAAQNTNWLSSSSILCNVGYGIGGSIQFNLLFETLNSVSISQAVTYDTPSISSIIAPNSFGSKFMGITVAGRRFGLMNFSPINRGSQTSTVETRWLADTSIFCKTADGLSRTLQIVISSGVHISTGTDAASYETSAVSVVANLNLARNAVSFSTISGSNFGKSRCAE